ncbi:MAG TPA: alpha/beta fold hydrolase [Chitinophagales bacterium]
MKLNYKQFGQGEPLIILHGLLGSLDNWQSIAKKLAERNTVYIIDQRNHGKSPHSDDFSYEILVEDLLNFYAEHNLQTANLLGHSMGGKAVMLFALMYPEKVNKLLVADVAPVDYEDKHRIIFNALLTADLKRATTRDDVQKNIEKYIQDKANVQFLMKGLDRDENNNFVWRFNVEALHKHYNEIMGFPSTNPPGGRTGAVFSKPTLFLKGEKSDYITSENYPQIERYFPNNEITEIAGAGHWVHADNPAAFIKAVESFL